MTLLVAGTNELGEPRLRRLRAMLELAYDGDFAPDDWAHALGGTHVWIEDAGEILAHASLVARDLHADGVWLRTGYVEAVATVATHRSRGLATRVMRAIGERIHAEYELGALSTGEHGFYARLGWERWLGTAWVGEPDARERTPDDEDSLMVLRTPRTPALRLAGELVADPRAGDVW